MHDTCRCGSPATVACVDLVEVICWPCWDDFSNWADAHPHTLFAEWPGRALATL